ncbi:MAG: hypothetical protein EOO77_47940 [Oxalobacteraceae bacterium]|nr:MAG: hypothetical protein EOO77_47940 [Oxalobacteraceae bacterium]
MSDMTTHRAEMIDEIKLRLGYGMVDVELDPEHYSAAVNIAVRYYRQRSTNAQLEGFAFLEVQTDVPTYSLPQEVQEVRAVYRQSMSSTGLGGGGIDPFSMSFTNNIFMLQNTGGSGLSGSGVGTLATYDLAMGFQKLTGRMFGRDIQFTFDPATKRITFHRRFIGGEEIGLHVYVARSEESLCIDPYARPWIEEMATAQCKQMLGQGRGA